MTAIYQQIQLPTVTANFSIRVNLGSDVYRLSFHYNERLTRWFLSMYDQDDSAIFEGYALLLGLDYLRMVRDDRLPDGILILDDSTSTGTECGFDDLGERCNLYYVYDDGVTA